MNRNVFLISILMIGFIFVFAASNNFFVKAQGGTITGTIVLSDARSTSQYFTSIKAPISLPGSACDLYITGCGNWYEAQSSSCRPSISFDGVECVAAEKVLNNEDNCNLCSLSGVSSGLHEITAVTYWDEFPIHYLAVAFTCS